MRGPAGSLQLHLEGPFGAESKFGFGRLAIDQIPAPIWDFVGCTRSDAAGFFADNEEKSEVGDIGLDQGLGRFYHRRDRAFGITGSAAVDILAILVKFDIWRHGVG